MTSTTSTVSQPTNETKAFKTFKVITTTYENGHQDRSIELSNQDLRDFFRNHTNLENSYDEPPVIRLHQLVEVIDQIKTRADRYNQKTLVKDLVNFVDRENASAITRTNNLLSNGVISFGLLKHIFAEGAEIEIHGDEIRGGKVLNCQYRESFFGGPYLQIRYEYISTNGNTFVQCQETTSIRMWDGTREVDKLPVRPISAEMKARLTARGELFAKVANGASYMQYTGHMGVKRWWSWNPMRAEGRIMVDAQTYGLFNNDNSLYDRSEDDTELKSIDSSLYWMTDPYVLGFSFASKQWGRFAVEQISNIDFRTDAFDKLVLAQDKKDLINALVTNATDGFTDIISGKGGGCIFLLHGEPGVGKTLTAEAIAELLQRPLYSVSVGELGVNTTDLEENLRKILDVAQIWNAVILIDEADIFLEKRTSGDILRNAMVGIFLRLLEYHQGVLFLTTNRVTEFDSAFHSRISIALKYGKLTQEARGQIWKNLLEAANITGLDPVKLAETDINGRQIKSTIRLAQGLAKQQGVAVNASHISATLAVSQQFQQDLKQD